MKEYFEEARFVYKHLPNELHGQLSEKVIQGLDDEIVRRVIGGIMRKEKKELDNVISTIESVIGLSLGDQKDTKSAKTSIDNPLSAMSPRDRIFTQIMNEIINILKALQISSNQDKARPVSYRNQSAPQSVNQSNQRQGGYGGGNLGQ